MRAGRSRDAHAKSSKRTQEQARGCSQEARPTRRKRANEATPSRGIPELSPVIKKDDWIAGRASRSIMRDWNEATGFPMKINQIRLKNFHCFEDREFSFGSRFNLIIGDNATGKTTLLDALSVGLGSLLLGFPEACVSATDSPPTKSGSQPITMAIPGPSNPSTPRKSLVLGNSWPSPVTWRRALTSKDGRTTRQDADRFRAEASRLSDAVKRGEPVNLPVVSYYGTGRLWVQSRPDQDQGETKSIR